MLCHIDEELQWYLGMVFGFVDSWIRLRKQLQEIGSCGLGLIYSVKRTMDSNPNNFIVLMLPIANTGHGRCN